MCYQCTCSLGKVDQDHGRECFQGCWYRLWVRLNTSPWTLLWLQFKFIPVGALWLEIPKLQRQYGTWKNRISWRKSLIPLRWSLTVSTEKNHMVANELCRLVKFGARKVSAKATVTKCWRVWNVLLTVQLTSQSLELDKLFRRQKRFMTWYYGTYVFAAKK